MGSSRKLHVAIVDYGLGNLFSVKQACEHVGMAADITASHDKLIEAEAIFLPGVGAFGDAMASLKRLDLINLIKEQTLAGKPLIGICLGLQLLMSESHEFGRHEGLGIIDGTVIPFNKPRTEKGVLKVPQVGWNNINRFNAGDSSTIDQWAGTPLEGIRSGEFMYFVHSFYVKPVDSSIAMSTTQYGDVNFCSSLLQKNIFASQFHPERSGPHGLQIYRNFLPWIRSLRTN